MSFPGRWIGVLLLVIPAACHWKARAPLPSPRAGYAAGVLNHGLIVAGGSAWTEGHKIQTAEANAFDPDCNCWSQLPSLPEALSDAESVTVGGQLFVLGGAQGERGLRHVYSFDGRQWRLRNDMELPEPRLLGAAVTDGKRIFLLGGISTPGDYTAGLKTAWSMDPAHPSNGWTPMPECPGAARATFGAVFVDGRILIAGGYDVGPARSGNLSDLWSFNISSRTWSSAGRLPEGRRAMAAIVVGNHVVLLGGFTHDFSADVLALGEKGAVLIGQLPQPVADIKFSPIGSRWYATGGEIGVRMRGSETWSGEIILPAAENRP